LAKKEVQIPDIGDFEDVDVIEVLVSPGDKVNKEDSLITLESDKATMEIPAPYAGVVEEIKVSVGDTVSQGTPIVTLELSGEEGATEAEPDRGAEDHEPEPPGTAPEPEPADRGAAPPPARPRTEPAASPTTPSRPPAPGLDREELADASAPKPHASPGIRRFARELGVDLRQVRGSGPKDRILKEDVQQFVKTTIQERPAAGQGLVLPEMPQVDFAKFGEIEARPLSRIQKISSASLHRNWVSIPHVTQFDEADITELEQFRKGQMEELSRRGIKLTLLAFIMKACTAVLKEFAHFNASLDPAGENLIVKKYFHIGVAVDTPEGLVVPVIRDVDKKGLTDIARELGEISGKARDKQLMPSDMQGGTFTISSLGGLGGTGFTPIINAPEVAILGVSRASMRPVYQDGGFVPRLLLPFSLSYDHRVIDGADAVRFTSALRADLSDVRRILL
jgi:pyruvate dehydrogenase E2 component (dihydrolipoamide acetyltransferase)